MMTDNILEIRGLVKTYPQFQLGPLDLTVPKGAIYGLVGPNAAGKTTTIDLIMGMGMAEQGTITVFGMDHRKDEVEVKKRIGYVSPDLSYNPWRTVKRLVHFIHQFYPAWDAEYCENLLERLGLGWNDSIPSMSFGSKIKLAVTMALAHHPDLLLLDEPTIGVDAVSKQEIFSELLAAVQDEEHTVLISSHGLADIERFADHIGIIHQGKMRLEGRMDTIVERYKQVDFEYGDGALPISGLYAVRQSGNRWKAIVDTQNGTVDALQKQGARNLSQTPVTLEELFIALAKEK
jgi:ABC-2 type transport system ATP-binding protein